MACGMIGPTDPSPYGNACVPVQAAPPRIPYPMPCPCPGPCGPILPTCIQFRTNPPPSIPCPRPFIPNPCTRPCIRRCLPPEPCPCPALCYCPWFGKIKCPDLFPAPGDGCKKPKKKKKGKGKKKKDGEDCEAFEKCQRIKNYAKYMRLLTYFKGKRMVQKSFNEVNETFMDNFYIYKTENAPCKVVLDAKGLSCAAQVTDPKAKGKVPAKGKGKREPLDMTNIWEKYKRGPHIPKDQTIFNWIKKKDERAKYAAYIAFWKNKSSRLDPNKLIFWKRPPCPKICKESPKCYLQQVCHGM